MNSNNGSNFKQNLSLYTLLFVITLFCIIIVGEIAARYFVHENILPSPPPPSTIDPYSPNPYITVMRPFMHFHIPKSHYIQSRSYYSVDYSINSLGFRGPEIEPKSKDKKRAVVIGDSIVEGHGCQFEKTFSYRLGEKAEEFNWEVLNLGVQGASPAYFAANIDRYMAADPDAAIIIIFENDLYDDRVQEQSYFDKPILDNSDFFCQIKKSNGISLNSTNFNFNEILHIYYQYSRLTTLFKRALYQLKENKFEKILTSNKGIDIYNDEQRNIENKAARWLVAPSMFDKQWGMSEKYMNYISQAFQKRKIPIFIIYLSLGCMIPGQDEHYSIHANMLNYKMEQWCKSKNIPFLSLLPLINDALSKMPPTDIMIEDDGHPTPKAHQMFADRIWQWFEALGKNNNNNKK